MIQLKPINDYMYELTIKDKLILFSYGLFVAAKIQDKFYSIDNCSKVSKIHIQRWIRGAEVEEKPKEFFEKIF